MRRLTFAATALASAALSVRHPAIAAAAVALLSAGIACTFGWLWWRRATPLAAGLALTWGGLAAIVTGTWSGPAATTAGVALALLGARLHLGVITGAGAARIAVAGMMAALVGAAALL